MKTFEHILVPTDFSDPSKRALDMAIELAQKSKARLTLLHVWNLPYAGYAEALAWPIDEMEAGARTALEELRVSVAARLPGVEAMLEMGREWQTILEVAKAKGVDLIVMGTHGRHGLPRFFLGSVAEKIVRLSPVPVLTVGMPPEPAPRATPA